MLSYGNIYEFAFDSQNGADFLIVVAKKYYSGEVMRRPLGRAPILKRENNGHIYGTSLEIYAECTVDGEYAQFYTSDAFEFRVQLYKNGSLLWMGYVSPELYSEPDVAPPYDVQIIATDSLGELKNYTFTSDGPDSLLNHLNHILGMSLSYQMISDLRYEKSSGAMSNSSSEVMNVRIDLGHEDGENCYDVLQRLLESFNLNITQYNERWLLFRHADLINLASSDGVIAHDSSGSQVLLDIAHFGSMNECEWWPVGQMSTVIEPARKKVTVQSPNHYANNALNAADWDVSNGASYDSTAGAYILPDEGSYIVQRLDFPEEVGYRLALRIRAMNFGEGDEDQGLGIILKVNAHVAAGYADYYLLQHEETDRGPGSYYWYTKEGWIEGELAVPTSSDTPDDAQDIDIIIPLYDSRDQGFGTRSWIYAKSIEVTIFNPQGTHDIRVYGVQLSKYDQSEGYQSDVTINNGAREEGDDIEMSLTDGSTVPAAGSIFMTGVPMEYPSAVITKWVVGDDTPDILLNTISKDYAREVALPRMRYTGSLNVPKGMTIPVLFIRDNTFYFPNTYSYDLWNDEVEVDLISVPAAEVSIASSVISQMASSGASSSGGSGSGGGGGIGTGIDLSGFARKDDLTALSELLASMWSIDPDTWVLTTDKDVRIKGNLIVEKDSASGGTSDSTTNIGTVDHIIVSGKPYYPDNAGIVDLSEAFEGLQVDIDLSGYLKTTDIADWAKAATKPSYTKAEVGLGNVDNTADSAKSVLYAATAGSAPASDVYAWAKKSSLAASDVPDLSNTYQPLATAINTGNIGNQTVAKANQLTTARTIWGQSFNGTADVTGALYLSPSKVNTLDYDSTTLYVGYGWRNALSVIYGSPISFNAGETSIMRVTSTGVGIGVTTPLSKLQVNGQINLSNGTNNNYAFITQDNYSANTSWLKLGTCYGYNSESIAMTIYNGMVKIGNGIPTCALDVNGDAKISGNVIIEGNLIVKGDSASGGTSGSNIAYLPLAGGIISGALTVNGNLDLGAYLRRAGNTIIDFSGNAPLFGYGSAGAGLSTWLCGYELNLTYGTTRTTGLHINSSGNVGIGGVSNGFKLDVKGKMYINGSADESTVVVINNAFKAYGYQYMGMRFTHEATEKSYIGWNSVPKSLGWSNSPGFYLHNMVSDERFGLANEGGAYLTTSLTTTGTVTQGSDIRFKNKKYDYILDIAAIAVAPLFAFVWNDRVDSDLHIGTSAQYWESIVPQLVSGTDFKALDYSTLGVAMGISLAKKTVDHEERIKALEGENKALKEQLNELYNGAVRQ